jgi:hypothetical protein
MQSPTPQDQRSHSSYAFLESSKSKILLRYAVIVMALACAATSPLRAQFRTSVQGTVTDPQGAVIPGATVTLRDVANNAQTVRTSDGAGLFNFGALPPDNFTLTVEATGFQKKVLTNIKFIPEQPNSLNVALTLGASDLTIEVNASSTPTLDTETANTGGTISANDIQHIPSFNRDVFTLSQLAPGAISTGAQSSGGGVATNPGNQGPGGSGTGGSAPTENGPQVNSNGQQYGNNGISLDGISTVSAVWGGTSIITPSPEAIDNVRIVTNGYDAEEGRFSGAETMVTTKSGGNQVHGSLFIDIHRPGLNAVNRPVRDSSGMIIGTSLKDTSRYNQYGGSVGGPIWKDKLFAFFAYETSPNNSTATSTGWYETASLRASANPSSIASKYVNFAGNAPSGTIVTSGETCSLVGLQEGVNCATIAGQGLDIGSPLTNGLGKQDPTSTGTNSNPGVGNGLDGVADVAFYSIAAPSSSTYTQYAGRLDAQASRNDHVSFTMFWVPQTRTNYNGTPRAYNLFHHEQINQATSAIWNHTFSPSLINEARVNAAGWRWNEITSNPQQPLGLPIANVGFSPNDTLGSFGSSAGSILNQWTFSYKDVATKVLGSHTVKFGGEYTALHYLQDPVGQPSYGFYDIWAFLNDAPYQEGASFNSVTGIPGGVRSDQRQNLFGAFVQDDWKVRSNLTLHAGLRYNYFGALYSKQNNIPNVTFGQGASKYTGLTIADQNGIWNPQKLNFGPQVSFNWSPKYLNGKTVIRGGYGIAFNQNEVAITANASYNPPTSNYYSFQFDNPTTPGASGSKIVYGISSSPTSIAGYPANPNAIATYNTAGLPTAGSANIIIAGDGHGNVPTTYYHHFSLDIQQELSRWAVFTLGYQGSLGRHIINHQTPNAPAVVEGVALNQLVTTGDYWINSGSSRNHAMLAGLSHPFSHGLSAQAQFMWSKSQDTDGSGPYSEDPYYPLSHSLTYGRSDYNVGKSLKIFGTWQPVFFHGNNIWAEKVAGGWTLSGIFSFHTGFPYSALYNLPSSLYCNTCGYTQLRAGYLGGARGDHSNSAFINNTNFAGQSVGAVTTKAAVNGNPNTPIAYSNRYFNVANFQNSIQLQSTANNINPTVALPNLPGSERNLFDGPNYHDLDVSLAKAFGLPKLPVLGENAKFEIRADALNLFNILNLNPSSVNTIVDSGSFGQDTSALGSRSVTMSARFEF